MSTCRAAASALGGAGSGAAVRAASGAGAGACRRAALAAVAPRWRCCCCGCCSDGRLGSALLIERGAASARPWAGRLLVLAAACILMAGLPRPMRATGRGAAPHLAAALTGVARGRAAVVGAQQVGGAGLDLFFVLFSAPAAAWRAVQERSGNISVTALTR
jgi:hypothetical protein